MIDMTSVPIYDVDDKQIFNGDLVEDENGETYRVAVVNGTAYLDTGDWDEPFIDIEDSRKLKVIATEDEQQTLDTARRKVFKAAQNYLHEQQRLEDATKDLNYLNLHGLAQTYGKDEIACRLTRLNQADDDLIEACRTFVKTADKLTEDKT